jgi:hypothetical protein
MILLLRSGIQVYYAMAPFSPSAFSPSATDTEETAEVVLLTELVVDDCEILEALLPFKPMVENP